MSAATVPISTATHPRTDTRSISMRITHPISAATVLMSAATVLMSAATVSMTAATVPISAATHPRTDTRSIITRITHPISAATVLMSAATVPMTQYSKLLYLNLIKFVAVTTHAQLLEIYVRIIFPSPKNHNLKRHWLYCQRNNQTLPF